MFIFLFFQFYVSILNTMQKLYKSVEYIVMNKNLSDIIKSFPHNIYNNNYSNPTISNIAFDSRKVKNNTLFFALPGTHVHGNKFIGQAIKNGAVAIVFQDELPKEALDYAKQNLLEGKQEPVFIQVQDSRFAMSPASATFYDNPSKKLVVIGVTGTEGKSSTVSFIWQLLRLCEKKAGFISTVQYSLGDNAINNPEHQTTPEAPIVQKQLYEMVQAGCEYAVIESSSHGLSSKTNRLGDVLFDVAVWMNVTHEHLEFHGTHEQYKFDKANLFRNLDSHNHIKTINKINKVIPSFGIINLEDPSAEYFSLATKQNIFGFSSNNFEKSVNQTKKDIPIFSINNLKDSSKGISFSLKHENTDYFVNAPTSGAFNAYNITAAIIAVSKTTKINIENVSQKCKDLIPVKGRMTVIDEGQNFEIIVDYAHTPSSFETIFPPLKQRAKGKIIALFGSGGERDIQKRPEQGKIAGTWCDTIILTDEDPRGENSLELLEMIAVGCRSTGKTEGNGLFIIPDRKKAIRKAFDIAQENDIVLLLGKAHENSIIYKDYIMPYDEISEAKQALTELNIKTK